MKMSMDAGARSLEVSRHLPRRETAFLNRFHYNSEYAVTALQITSGAQDIHHKLRYLQDEAE